MATDNAAITFTQGSHTAARNAAANKNINQKITRWAMPNRFVFSGYIRRYTKWWMKLRSRNI
jgi:hypothetical protein